MSEAHKVPLTPDMADALVLPSKAPSGVPAEAHATRREGLLLRAARLLRKQEAFQLATKMYTQAGDNVKAMKCLIRSGDKEKIMVFAGVSRSKEIYVLAANYLQVSASRRGIPPPPARTRGRPRAQEWRKAAGRGRAARPRRLTCLVPAAPSQPPPPPFTDPFPPPPQSLDWRTDGQVTKAIISFYTKAKAWGQLSGFFDACAQVEIDDFRNYDKAIGAMSKAKQVASKITDGEAARPPGPCPQVAPLELLAPARVETLRCILLPPPAPAAASRDAAVSSLESRIATMEKYSAARRAAADDPDTMLALCGELLDTGDVDQAIRSGDVFTLLIEHYFRGGEADK